MTEFDEIWQPIIGATSEYQGHEPVYTPPAQVERVSKLKESYAELRTDLMDEVNMMDIRIISPATEAKNYIQPLKKTIKKRENKRLDLEKYQDRVHRSLKKPNRTERENTVLAKAQEDLSKATDVSLSNRYIMLLICY